MLRQYQDSSATQLDRYPEIFERVAALMSQGRVLSFGCSTGEEVRTLKAQCADWDVHGVEQNQQSLQSAREADPVGTYAPSIQCLPPGAYNVVFCMSVLCRFPPVDPEPFFTFEEFEEAVDVLDNVLAPGGLLVLWNAQYDFRETRAAAHFAVCDLGLCRGLDGFAPDDCLVGDPGSGFVPKYTRKGCPLPGDVSVPLAYRKGS
jgi:SAM-dependent methyltransferase